MSLARAWASTTTQRWVVAAISPFLHGGAVTQGHSDSQSVGLTFDDGPHPRWTPELLDRLDAHSLLGTFFVVGQAVAKYPEIVKETRRRGHEIGSHLYFHKRPKRRDTMSLKGEIERSRRELEHLLGESIRLLRFPYAEHGGLRASEIRSSQGLHAIHWTFSSHDSRARNEREIVQRVSPRLRAGAIVLMHDCLADGDQNLPKLYNADRTAMLASIPLIARLLHDKHLRSVTVSEMVALDTL